MPNLNRKSDVSDNRMSCKSAIHTSEWMIRDAAVLFEFNVQSTDGTRTHQVGHDSSWFVSNRGLFNDVVERRRAQTGTKSILIELSTVMSNGTAPFDENWIVCAVGRSDSVATHSVKPIDCILSTNAVDPISIPRFEPTFHIWTSAAEKQ